MIVMRAKPYCPHRDHLVAMIMMMRVIIKFDDRFFYLVHPRKDVQVIFIGLYIGVINLCHMLRHSISLWFCPYFCPFALISHNILHSNIALALAIYVACIAT